jgi:hypothetical protein
MDIQEEIRAIDRMLEAYGIPLERFCGYAKIHPRSWRNWRNGAFLPQLAKWQQVLKVVEDLKAERKFLEAYKRGAIKVRSKHSPA